MTRLEALYVRHLNELQIHTAPREFSPVFLQLGILEELALGVQSRANLMKLLSRLTPYLRRLPDSRAWQAVLELTQHLLNETPFSAAEHLDLLGTAGQALEHHSERTFSAGTGLIALNLLLNLRPAELQKLLNDQEGHFRPPDLVTAWPLDTPGRTPEETRTAADLDWRKPDERTELPPGTRIN